VERRRDLRRQLLLDLQAPRQAADEGGEPGDPDDSPVREVGHVRLAVEGQEVVDARRDELDVLDRHEIAASGRSQGFEDPLGALGVA